MRTELEQNFTRARNTERMYEVGWRQFADWCERAERPALPASAETLALYVVWALETRGYRLQTVKLYLAAIRDHHKQAGAPDATGHPDLLKLLALERRQRKERRGAKKALPLWALKKIVALIDPKKPTELRNRALLVLGFNAGLRRSELVNLDLASVVFHKKGLDLYLGATKADPTGAEPPLFLPYAKKRENFDVCPVRNLQAWLKVRGDAAGPLFLGSTTDGILEHRRLAQDYAYEIMKRYVERIGLDPKLFGAHSLRSGMMTHAAEQGADLAAIMKRSRHKSPEIALSYLNQLGAFQSDVMGF